MYKNIFPEIDKNKLDSQVTTWLSNGITASDFEKKINEDFYILTYIFATKLINKKFIEDVPDIVTDVMEDFINKLRQGIIPFKSNSKFSTYLHAIISNKINTKYKTYYPTPIQRLGSDACYLYYLILVKNYNYKLAITECHQIHNTNIIQLNEWIGLIESYRDAANDRMIQQGQIPQEVSFSRNGDSDDEYDEWEPEVADDIHDNMEKRDLNIRLNHSIKQLPETEQSLIMSYYMDNKSFKDIQKEIPTIKNVQYELRKAENMLRRMMDVNE